MTTLKPLYQVPATSTDFLEEAHFHEFPLEIRFSYRRDGVSYRSGIRFHNVPATRTRAERCCTVWHIDAYDTLVEVENSPWAEEIRADTSAEHRDRWRMHHYMIYLDSSGCIEVIAESWEAIPEEAGVWK